MFEDIDKQAVVGTKQVLRALQAGTVRKVYLAEDVDPFIQSKVKEAALRQMVELEPVPGKKQLGEACGIDVDAACVGITGGNG